MTKVDAATGSRFSLGPVVPGTYSITVESAPGDPQTLLGKRAIRPGETWSLGTGNLLRGGAVSVSFR